jgi:hypothetical protein
MLRNYWGNAVRRIAICLLALLIMPAAKSQTPAARVQPLITRPVDNDSLTTLHGNTRGEAKTAANDLGLADDSMPLPEMRIQLRRPAAQEQAFEQLIEQLHDANSPNYHRWLTAAEIGAQFGPAQSDIEAVSAWLRQNGFTVNAVAPSGMLIDFSGNAGQVRRIFRTEIHNVMVRGRVSHANVSDPQVPAALSPAMVGILGLENIPGVAHHKRLPPRGGAHPEDTTANCSNLAGGVTGTACYGVVPADLATIYNFNPVFNGGNTGQGQTIYMIEDTDLYADSDWTTFRSAFGLSGYTQGSLTTVHPGGCSDPGTNSSDDEATLDVEWGSAAAPSAAIVEASCHTILLAVQNTVAMQPPPPIMSISYGDCEAQDGETTNQAFYLAYQQGVAEGMSIFGATGDHGPDDCEDAGDNSPPRAHDGLGVDGWSSTPYNVAVGGTDFSPVFSGTASTYWSSTNSANFGSAKSYIPEMAWNGDCSSLQIAGFFGYSDAYTFCNSQLHGEKAWKTYPFSSGGGEGGQSGCATGAPNSDTPLVVSGTCAGYTKPSWQNVLGNIYGDPTNDNVRDTPDVSLFASWDIWNVGYVVCFTDPNNGGLPCTGNSTATWWNGGGTSFATPIWAGIQALINTATGTAQGLPNVRLYQLAAAEYGSSGNSSCNSSNGNTVGSSCIFYDVTLGDTAEPCYDLNGNFYNCYDPGGTGATGVMSAAFNDTTPPYSYTPAYQAGTGWDFVSGIGTVNVYNLLMAWGQSGASHDALNVSVAGNGTITSIPSSIDCQSTCSASYGGGTMVTLTAAPASGFIFTGWSGACSGTGSCVVTMSAAESVSATFSASGGGATAVLFIDPENGSDSGVCPQTSPCRSLNYALSMATAGSTIDIERGGSFGPIYITQPITINGPADGSASIVWLGAEPGCVGGGAGSCNGAAANYAVEIFAGASAAVELNNLVIDNGAGTNGAVHIASAASVSMKGNALRGGTGSAPQLLLMDSSQGSLMQLMFKDCDFGLSGSGGGIFLHSSSPASLNLSGSQVHNLTFGVKLNATSLSSGSSLNAVIDATEFFGFGTNAIVLVATSGGNATATVSRSTISQSADDAIYVDGSTATALLYGNVIGESNTGVSAASGGASVTFGNNSIFANTTNVTGNPLSAAPGGVGGKTQ